MRTSALAASRSSASPSGRSTCPSASIRSSTVRRRSRGTSGLGLLEEQVVEVVAHLGADLQHVAESAGGDQPDPGSGPLDDGVGDQGGAVHDAVDVGEFDPRLAGDALHTLADRDAGIGHAGELLAGEDHAPAFVDEHEVREGAPHVNADAAAAHARPRVAHSCLRWSMHCGPGSAGTDPAPRRGRTLPVRACGSSRAHHRRGYPPDGRFARCQGHDVEGTASKARRRRHGVEGTGSRRFTHTTAGSGKAAGGSITVAVDGPGRVRRDVALGDIVLDRSRIALRRVAIPATARKVQS